MPFFRRASRSSAPNSLWSGVWSLASSSVSITEVYDEDRYTDGRLESNYRSPMLIEE